MGAMATVNTKAHTALDEMGADGSFKRTDSVWRNWVSSEIDSKFKPEKDRYHLYVAYACPWAHRALIARSLKGLEDVISVTAVMPVWQKTKPGDSNDTHCGWMFADEGGKPHKNTIGLGGPFPSSCPENKPDPHFGAKSVREIYEQVGDTACLPGCFTMYRILNDDGKPLLADDHVYAEYLRNDIDSLHEQNLFHLGEDRMLTTLLLHFFPSMFLTYVPEAQCWTIVPHSLRILLSQRRRWINSTYHNLLELTKVNTMCGVCCCSMKTVVYLDLIACMILPASTVYAAYLIFLVAAGKTQFSILLLVLYGLIIGVQIVVFIVRSRYDFLFWFTYFTIIGVPVFYFVLPLYAFWHMDDFSWGETRKVAAMKSTFSKPPPKKVEEDDDEGSDEGSEEGSEYSDEDTYDDSKRSGRGSRRSIT